MARTRARPAAARPKSDTAPAVALAALDALDDAYIVVDANWRIVAANRAFARFRGDEPAAFTGRELWDVLPPLAREYESALVRSTAADGLRRSFRAAGFTAGAQTPSRSRSPP